MKESQLAQKLKKHLANVVQNNGSDLHLSVGDYPIMRIDGVLYRLSKEEIISHDDMDSLSESLLNKKQMEKFLAEMHVDFSLEIDSQDRFRANMFHQKGHISLALRFIPKEIRSLDELGVPDVVYDFIKKTQGLLLLTGPTGHGKSTTLAALIDHINHNRQEHIVTIEDPVEYLHHSDQCLIEQREIGKDALDFGSALTACFREDVDVVLVGEMRDLETISTAITAAETGHLILGTLHTNDSVQTVDRIIDVFPAYQQNQIRFQLANVLLGVVSQRLLKKIGGGRVPAVEVLIKNRAVENLIRQNQTHQIGVTIETSLEDGMIGINRALANLVKEGQVTLEDAEMYSTDVNSFRMLLETA
ncbi:PilT/PilU family type 4a pilus ATPase [bacterium]|jgi:twitching motility protein PilT|nr:PilT/PilU family type 4a pilus ATPase [bacterium]MBT4250738.1 PilT/PilU family type 4a pilus ATPase [bacterium]MBT4598179.1 PilT/PilU family type 4a pilus ATPase [bacterium]MBT6753777.1 PilT/PilU family type 4a pilus ATPase [bacterium]MBT7037510.1 PilT/PilU family type 4a pilus ATPase [bacterium]